MALDEGPVTSPRTVSNKAEGGTKFQAFDAVHIPRSYHHTKLAQDLVLYIGDEWISDGGHPAWTLLGERWESYHQSCSWGGRFRQVDSVHFSFGEGKS